jgi:menaquinone-dependent protoporphyrinogen oxidase
MATVVIAYSTVDGHTRKICERLAQLIDAGGDRVTLVAIEDARAVELNTYDKVVVGASIRYGRHRRSVFEFVNANARIFDPKPNAFFSVNVVARKPQRDQPQTNPYVRSFLRRSRWQPKVLDVFAGKLDYPRYGWLDRLVIRLIMWITRGPTDPTAVVEFTDWQRVDAFAARIAAM